MLYRFTYPVFKFLKRFPYLVPLGLVAILILAIGPLVYAKIYQRSDKDPDRGAIAFEKHRFGEGAFGENYSLPMYLEQGWKNFDSLWFYNTSQGSGLMPYDLFMALTDESGKEPFASAKTFDKYRYLPQKVTRFNPDGLAVGFVKATYKGKDYVGYTCAACHTGQINFTEKAGDLARAIRIDGGPAMADMVGFLTSLEGVMKVTRENTNNRRTEFIAAVRKYRGKDTPEKEITDDLERWYKSVQRYNLVNKTDVAYGHARLDAFGRIYNRVAQYAISGPQLKKLLRLASSEKSKFLLEPAQIDAVMAKINTSDKKRLDEKLILTDEEFSIIVDRIRSGVAGYPGLDEDQFKLLKNKIFNEPDAPVSYPFLWDISHSDFLQWNGLAPNAGVGPLGRNTGEVIGVFGILDWEVVDSWLKHPLKMLWQSMSLSSWVSGQQNKKHQIAFDSSINLFNLQRLESLLRDLKSPEWPFCKTKEGDYFIPETAEKTLSPSEEGYCKGKGTRFEEATLRSGELIYIDRCRGCHTVVDRSAWDRIVVGHMSDAKRIGTDDRMAHNAVHRTGKSGNFFDTYQETAAGNVIVAEDAPVVQILTSATRGVIATPDADKWWPRRMVEWIYTLVMSFADNPIKKSIKNGDYNPDTTAEPYASLGAYKGRSLNGIWATAPYLHNGSVPTLWDLLQPSERRPKSFKVGAREFDPNKVGFVDKGDEFGDIDKPGNSNGGHDYFCKKKPKADAQRQAIQTQAVQTQAVQPQAIGVQKIPAPEIKPELENFECMTPEQINDLMEYLKSL